MLTHLYESVIPIDPFKFIHPIVPLYCCTGHLLKPDVLSVIPSTYNLTVAWKQSSRCFEQFQLTHEVQWKKKGDTEWASYVLPSSTTQLTISGLAAATSYDVRVRAVGTDVESSTITFSHFSSSSIGTLTLSGKTSYSIATMHMLLCLNLYV